MNGQMSFDNKEARFLGRSSEAYKLWSEMAEFERKTCQDWSQAKDPKAIEANLDVAVKARNKMSDAVMSRCALRIQSEFEARGKSNSNTALSPPVIKEGKNK
jgi:hypothetical protein